MLKYKNYLFKYASYNFITNINFSEIAPDEIPHSVKCARSFPDRDSLMKYLHYNNVKNPVSVKCAYEIGCKNGESLRDVPQFALFGHFSNKLPFILSDLSIHGQHTNLYYNAIVENVQIKGKMTFNSRKTPEAQYHSYNLYKWEYYRIPISSPLGKVITWYTTNGNVPQPIPINHQNTKKNNEIVFSDKRPNSREKGIPDGTQAGKHCAHYNSDTAPKRYYNVKTVNKAGEIKWIRQNNCQLCNVDIPAEIAAGNIIAL